MTHTQHFCFFFYTEIDSCLRFVIGNDLSHQTPKFNTFLLFLPKCHTTTICLPRTRKLIVYHEKDVKNRTNFTARRSERADENKLPLKCVGVLSENGNNFSNKANNNNSSAGRSASCGGVPIKGIVEKTKQILSRNWFSGLRDFFSFFGEKRNCRPAALVA